ncbi:MAG: FKBP-type peptidyl-prolyl cis-trans isomerase [Bacteroidales bacterium]|jgi:FKBP-type peptidyl-prolyl cis-trans isomerase|nr:FKBP-type peptidyl-prolyl cis-trans isomerase [Bacteroidales bacterium]
MNKRFFYIITIAIFMMQSCFNKNDYKTNDAGLEYLYRVESNSQKFPQDSNTLFLQIRYFNERDSLLFDSKNVAPQFIVRFEKPQQAGATLDNAYAMMQEGDSMSFLFNAREFFRLSNPQAAIIDSFAVDEKLRFEIKLEKVFTEEEIMNNIAKKMAEMKLEEELLLAEYIERNYPRAVPTESGMYVIQEQEGKGNYAKPADKVVIHYTVSYINGEPLYSTYTKVDPMTFNVSDHDVYPCLTEAVQKMKQGGKAIIIAPSKIAAGERGSRSQKIAPYKTLIFEIELMAIL